MKRSWMIAVVVVMCGAMWCVGGCAMFKPNTDPIERGVNNVMANVVQPVATKAIAELSTRTAQMQASAQGINPGYQVEWVATAGPATTGKVTVQTVGIAGQIAGAAQADAGQAASVPPPVMRPAQPAAPAPPATPAAGSGGTPAPLTQPHG